MTSPGLFLGAFTARKLSLLAAAVLGTVATTSALADNAPGWYVGGNVGRTYTDFDNARLTNSLAGQGFRVTSNSEDKHDTGYKLFGGYQLHRNFAIEGGYFDLGKVNYGVTTFPAGSFAGETKVRGLNLDLVGILPIGDRFSVFGRVGAAYAQSRSSFARTGNIALGNFDSRNNDTNVKVGLGAEYAFTPALSVRGEIERYRVSDPVRNKGYIDMASVGLVYRFGGPIQRPMTQTNYVPVASPPPPPPPPPPVVVAPPPPPPPPVAAPAPAPQPAYVPPPRPTRQDRN